MVNLLIDRHRRGLVERSAIARASVRSDDESRDIADIAAAEAQWWELIEPLPMRQRAIVALHYGDDQSVDEVADLLDISSGTVKSALAKARQKLQTLMAERGHDD